VRLTGSGADGQWTDEDTALPRRVAARLARRPGGADPDGAADRAMLARQRLAPLVPLLSARDSQPPIRRLVVLPSPWLADVPLEALGGAADGYTVSYAPSGTLFAWLREKGRTAAAGLLALGDPAAPAAAPAAPPDRGLYVQSVAHGSAADRAGVRAGDVLTAYAGRPLASTADLGAARTEGGPLQVWRDGRELALTMQPGPLGVRLDRRPPAEAVRSERAFAAALRGGPEPAVALLPGTRAEVEALARAFRGRGADVLELLGSEASEQRLAELAASGQLARYRYLHLATHGRVDRLRPWQSALLLARDRLPDPVAEALAGRPAYNGWLTAGDILRTWRLDAELVVLSACETGQGQPQGGEGYLGFAQALFLAGARALVLSLWAVDDQATALLMQRFYQNLLGQRDGLEKPLPKAEALREAKKWLRELTADGVDQEVARLPKGERGGERPRPKAAAAGVHPFAHPYFWSAFILIGDPG
jgi:hypothetical protein